MKPSILVLCDDPELIGFFEKILKNKAVLKVCRKLEDTEPCFKSRDWHVLLVPFEFHGKKLPEFLKELPEEKIVILYSLYLEAEKVSELALKGIITDFVHLAEAPQKVASKILSYALAGAQEDVRPYLVKFYNRVMGLEEKSLEPASKKLVVYTPEMIELVEKATFFARKRDLNILVIGEPGTGRSALIEYILEHEDRKGEVLKVEEGQYGYLNELADRKVLGYESVKSSTYETVVIEGIENLEEEDQIFLIGLLRSGKWRFITSATPDIFAKMSGGEFRYELYHYLAGETLYLLPLRERLKEEISLLLEHFLRKEGARTVGVSRKFYEAFLVYDWPGNLVEMVQKIKGALASLKKGEKMLDIEHLPPAMREPPKLTANQLARDLTDYISQRVDLAKVDIKVLNGLIEALKLELFKAIASEHKIKSVSELAKKLNTKVSSLGSPQFIKKLQKTLKENINEPRDSLNF